MSAERRLDTLMMADYRAHVERSLTGEPCDCSLTTPDRNCDLGYSLFALATRGDWDDRKVAFLARGRTGAP